MCQTDLYPAILLQFEQTVYKYLHQKFYDVDKDNENLVCHIFY